jgi:hypothetical protein
MDTNKYDSIYFKRWEGDTLILEACIYSIKIEREQISISKKI